MADVLLTGADGVVGFALVGALLARGDRVTLLRRPRPERRSALTLDGFDAHCAVVAGDLLDPETPARVLGRQTWDTVVHLAAQSIVGRARVAPVETYEANVAVTWRLLEACRRAEVGAVVVASSDKVYGPAGPAPSREDDVLAARYPYDVAKACADLVARSFAHTYGLPVAVARLPNTYGAGDPNLSRLVPELIAAVLAGRDPVIRSDGSPRRDFLHAEDAATAYLAIADALAAGTGAGEAYNAGSGLTHSVRELVQTLIACAGATVTPRYTGAGSPAGELPALHVDTAKLRAQTGWEPRVGLRDGLVRTLAWYRSHPSFRPAEAL